MEGRELLKLLENQRHELHFWQLFKKRAIQQRIESLNLIGVNHNYTKNQDGSYRVIETFDPDLYVRYLIKRKEVMYNNEWVSKCLACEGGHIFEIDPIEKIGQCNECLTEFKLA